MKRVVLSLEQATALPYATQRFGALGWRVVRIEPVVPGAKRQGDPNRYAGALFADEGRRSFFVPPNVGKEAIALNLKTPEGRQVLHRLLDALEVDVFCCNLLPARHSDFGVDYDTLSRLRPGLVWASISAMGTDYPDVPGYDPIIQAMSGLMALTGDAEDDPMMCGVPITDLKAGDEIYANVLLALLERTETGRGKRIDISMLQAAASWLAVNLPGLDMGDAERSSRRSGNFHRVFVPTGVYRANDGWLFIAIGNTPQWRALVGLSAFATLDEAGRWDELPVRSAGSVELTHKLAAAVAPLAVEELEAQLAKARIPHSRINSIADVRQLPAIRSVMPTTTAPDGQVIRLAPAAVAMPNQPKRYGFAPNFGEHTDAVLSEAGYAADAVRALREAGAVA
jgi:itaconate CoA-transferase